MHRIKFKKKEKKAWQGLPQWSSGWLCYANAGGMGSDPWSGN